MMIKVIKWLQKQIKQKYQLQLLKNKDGKTIASSEFNAPQPHTVQKGESVSQIVKNALKEQGFENPTKRTAKSCNRRIFRIE